MPQRADEFGRGNTETEKNGCFMEKAHLLNILLPVLLFFIVRRFLRW